MGLSSLLNRYQPNELFFEKATMSLKSSFKGFLGKTVINVTMWLKLEKDIYNPKSKSIKAGHKDEYRASKSSYL